MQRTRVYLDWNATTPLRPEARAAMAAAWDIAGNPSSVHTEGRLARKLVEEARASVAAALGADPRNVVFTSGGTEANGLALAPGLRDARGAAVERLIVSAIEHASVLAGGRFPADRIARLAVTVDGVVDLDDLRRLLASGPPALVSVMLANNETGAIQPIAEIADIVHAAGGLLHVDAIQALGRIDCHINRLNADLLALSSHKVGGPKGVGALVVRDGIVLPGPLIKGGGQEQNRRGGTENVPGIAGFGAAVNAAMAAERDEAANMERLQARLETGLRAHGGAVIFGEGVRRLPNTTLFSAPGLKAETAVIAFDLEGIAVSSGSACSSGKVTPSHVLAAMGVPADMAQGAIRLSTGWNTTESEVDRVLEAWRKVSAVLRRTYLRTGA
ncbi:cysteine desulfurase family protein [Bradyrhizobium prioriisuperbiae]|uniref:cysteine desulfurase family protein n=1 Tax=Bradyrhizobium prioriisuperbiae TaxID=2854389 RepID=UPI0028E8CAE4|nr:cysteine desulfurase family protein [Bradyrhizobium prioritasuperba]